MSRVAVKLSAPKPAKVEGKTRKGRARGAVRQAAKATPSPSAAALKAAAAQPTRTLPHRAVLEQRFGRGLGQIRAAQGPAVSQALDAAGAEAATIGDRVLLRPEAPVGTVAHEAAHALQPERTDGGDADRAEAEAQRVETQAASGAAVAPLRAARVPGMVAFKAPDSLAGARVVPKPDPAAAKAFRDADRTPDGQQGTTQPPVQTQAEPISPTAQGTAPDAAADRSDAPGADGTDAGDTPVPTFAAPTIPELDVDTDAAKEAAADADAQIAAAKDAGGMMAAFRTAPPSVKALRHDQLAGSARTLAEEDQAQFDRDLPKFEAKLSGTDDLAPLPPVGAPAPDATALEAGAPPPAPTPEVDPTPAATAAPLNPGGSVFAGLATPGDAASMGSAFAKLSTSDKRIETSAGKRPAVPTSGETDPARVATQDKAAREQADAKQQAANKAVLEGRGPEEAGLRSLREEIPVATRTLPEAEAVDTAAPGAVAFREGGHDTEVTALFDAHHHGPMAESLAQAEADTGAAVAKRNSDRDTKLAEAKAETDKLNRTADEGQRTEVLARRKDIQTARGKAVADQKGHVDALKTQAEVDRKAAKTEVDGQITTTDAQVAKDFTKAEGDAQAEVTAGEAKAEAERNRQKANAEKQSWWDRAKSWIQAQFDKLTKFINGVFDAVRKAVKKLIDAVKTAALKLIDAAAKAIKSAIEKLGTALKKAVTALLEKHFPEVAKALNAAIDKAVAAAKTAVDKVAEGLKTAVTAVLDTLAKGIDAILALYQKAINAALNLAKIALTADWGALAKMVLEPILLAFGIKPAEFYALIGKAIDALDIIVKNPAGFIKNLVKTVVGGLKLFGGKLFEHLQKGIIGWLTGALGSDLKIPKTWSLFGVLDLARQIMGLTLDFIRRIAVRVLGEKAVTVIEQVMGTIATFVKGGFAALWEQIKGAVGNLKSLVLEQIKSFLFERVLLASVTWLASLFNPAGAIVKLIMMTWNVLMFLKDQLGRMVDLVKKVFGTLYEIATGVLEPAQKGVEGVLGRTLPLVIDLFARLLGLGNVAGRVKKIIDGVRQKIEGAIVKLIKRIAGRGKGKRGKGDKKKKDRTDDLMKPIPVKGGGQSHTIFVREKGKNAVPVMRSVETEIDTWLTGLGTAKGMGSVNTGWSREERDAKREEVKADVAEAKRELAQMDRAADKANAAEDAAQGSRVPKTSQELAREGQQLAAVMKRIFTTLGLGNRGLQKIYSKQIREVDPKLKPHLQNALASKKLIPLSHLSWDDFIETALRDGLFTNKWLKPATTTGVLQIKGVRNSYAKAVAAVADPLCGGQLDGGSDKNAVKNFFDNYLTERLTPRNKDIAKLMLSRAGRQMVNLTTLVDPEIRDAAGAYGGGGKEGPDTEIKTGVTASSVKDLMLAIAEQRTTKRFQVRKDNDPAQPTVGPKGDLYDFIADPASVRKSFPTPPRHTKNRTFVAAQIRNATAHKVSRPHEWVQAANAHKVLKYAADAIGRGDASALKGAAELIEFQDTVRTPTTKLIFTPGGAYPSTPVKVSYKAPEHRAFEAAGNGTPTADQKKGWYTNERPAEGAEVKLVQGHSGGLYAYAQAGEHTTKLVTQSTGSSSWHKVMTTAVDAAAEKVITHRTVEPLKKAILDHYKATIWQGTGGFSDAESVKFGGYYDGPNSTTAMTYDKLKSDAKTEADKEETELEATLKKVTSK